MPLVLVGTPIGNLGDLAPRAVEELTRADLIACEDTRRTRALLTAAGVGARRRLLSLHEHNEASRVEVILGYLAAGERVALTSDAGMPLVSDPGQRLVAAALDAGYEVAVVPGPSAVLSALVLSGMDASRFCFEGFLPRSGRARTARLEELAAETRTAVLFEAPQRVPATLGDLARALGGDRRVAVARELTKVHEEMWRGTLEDAAGRYSEADARGEHVLVLEGVLMPVHEYADDQIEDALRQHLAEGHDKRAAVAAVVAELKLPKRRVYAIATTLTHP